MHKLIPEKTPPPISQQTSFLANSPLVKPWVNRVTTATIQQRSDTRFIHNRNNLARFFLWLFVFCLSNTLLKAQVGAPYCTDFLLKWTNSNWVFPTGPGTPNNLPIGIATDKQGNVYVGDNSTIKKFNSSGTLLATYGSAGSGNGQFQYIFGLSIDSQGNMYVADANNNRIQKLDASGQFVATYGSAGSGNGQFNQPHDVAVDAQGNMFITDYGNNRVVKLNASGQFVASWGSQGPGVNQFFHPWGIDIDSKGNIYIADSGSLNTSYNGNNRLVKLDASGNWLGTWGTQTTFPESGFNEPKGVAVDAQDNIYVTDNLYVHKIDSNLQLKGYWGGYGSGDGQFIQALAVAVSGLNNIYVVDWQNVRIQKFGCANCTNPVVTAPPANTTIATGQSTRFTVAATGTNLTYQWQVNTGSGFTNLATNTTYTGVTSATLSITNASTTLDGYQYQAVVTSGYCSSTATAATLTVTCATPVITAQPVNSSITAGQNTSFAVTVTGNNPTYQWQVNTGNGFTNLTNDATYAGVNLPTLSVSSASTALSGYQYRAIISSGTCSTATTAVTLSVSTPVALPCTDYIATIGSSSDIVNPTDIAVDGQGNVYVASMETSRVVKFDANGQVVLTLTYGSGNGQVSVPYGLAIDTQGNLYIADTYNNRIQKLNANGQFIATYGTQGSGVNQFDLPRGIALDAQGNIYITDTGNNRVVKLDATGQWVGTTPSSIGFSYPSNMTVDAQGNIYVTDSGNHRIVVLNNSLTLLAAWGSNGSGINQFSFPTGIANDAQGNIYVADQSNNRMVKLSNSGQWLGTWGTEGSGNGEFNNPSGVTVDAQGYVYVTEFSGNRVQKFGCTGCAALQITTQPTDIQVYSGQNATFSVTATSTSLTYQWQQVSPGGVYTDLTSGAAYSGVNSATLVISSTGTAISGNQYRAIISSGACSVTTTTATLTVFDAGSGGPVCDNYVTKKMADGLSSDYVSNVFALTGPGSTTVYAATSEGLNISTDGGQTFTGASFGMNDMFSLTGPSGTTLFVSSFNGLMISTDNGQTFTTRTTADGLGNNYVLKVYAVGTNVYAATYGGLSISTDGGQTFTNKTTANGLVSNEVIGVYAVGNTVYAITYNPGNSAGTTLHVSTDGGQTFTTRGPSNGFGTSSMLNSAGANSLYAVGNTVYVGTYFGIYISTNGGQTFTSRTTANGLGSDGVLDVQVIGNTVYAATDNGISISTDGGQTFTNKNTANGLGADRVSAVYATGNSIYIATQGGGISFCPPVTAVANLTLTASAAPSPVCVGSPVALAIAVSGGTAPYSYTWVAPAGVTLSATNASAVSATATTAGVQTFTITVAGSGGSPISTTTVSVTVAAAPSVSIAANPGLSITQGQSTTLTASGANTYNWSTGETTAAISTTAAGTYSVTGVTGSCSATLAVAVTISGPMVLPDLVPIMHTLPSTQYGTTNFTVAVDVFELNARATNGLITVYVTKDPLVNLSFNPASGLIGGYVVDNNIWTFDATSNPNAYIFTTNQVVPAGGKRTFGMTGVLTPGKTKGTLTITTTIVGNSGGDTNTSNNSDADRVDYFQK